MDNQSILVSWLPKDESIINRCLHTIMEILVINNEGKAETTKGDKLDILLNILVHKIRLHDISFEEDKWLLLYKTLFKLKTLEEQKLSNFKQLLSSEVSNYLDKPIKNCVILFPLHITSISLSKFRSFHLLGSKMIIRSWSYVKKHFSYTDFINKGKGILLLNNMSIDILHIESHFTPILATASGHNLSDIFNQTERVFDIFRFHLNMIDMFFRIKHQYGGYPTPMGKILPPPIYGIFTQDGDFEGLYYNTTTYSEYRENNISPKDFTNARKLANKLGNPQSENDTKNLLIKAIEIYGQVLDTSEWRLAYLFLWQILELLTLKTKDVTEGQVINRVKSIINLSQLQIDSLDVIYETRNQLVHTGKFPESNTYAMKEVGQLKIIAENLISKYYKLTTTYSSKEDLNKFLESLDKRK